MDDTDSRSCSASYPGSIGPKTQKCEVKGCLTCPLLFDPTDVIIINGQINLDFRAVNLDIRLNFKDRSISITIILLILLVIWINAKFV